MGASKNIAGAVKKIIARVARQGDKALTFYSRRFDGEGVRPADFFVGPGEIARGFQRTGPVVRRALKVAASRIERFHKEELKRLAGDWSVEFGGIRVGQAARPVSRAGIYVPGGRFCYPSTVLMAALPAKIAGVEEIILATPKKNLRNEILAASYLAGVDRILCLGGPWAIAALAYGTRSVPKVDKIAGPGNSYVTEAKRQVYGRVGIDGLAGPSEIAVWADGKADLSKVILNLASQAEHDPESRGFLFSGDSRVAEAVRREFPRQFLGQIRFYVLRSEKAIAEKINEIAPEHLYLAVKKPRRAMKLIRNAGAIFIGEDSVVPLGDYSAGPSHVLPTGGSARFGSGLSVKDFMKWSSTIERSASKGREAVQASEVLARVEGLFYHARTLQLCN